MRAGETVVYTSSDERLVGTIVDWPAGTPHVPSSVLQQLGLSLGVHERFEAAGRAWTLVWGSPIGQPMVLPEPLAKWALELVRGLIAMGAPPASALETAQHVGEPNEPPSEPLQATAPALGAFVLCIQPMFDLRTGAATRAEVLLRYDAPDEALIAWPQFNRNDVLQAMATRWALAQVLQHASRWRQADGIARVHLNVSIADGRSMEPLVDALGAAAPLECALLAIELAGSAHIDRSALESAVQTFREFGVEVGIDLDQVTSANVLNLYGLPIDFLKIRADDAHYVAMETMPWDVYVTCVQSANQWDTLRDRGVRYAQGYALEPPLTIADFEVQLKCGRFSRRNPATDVSR